ncbi:UDP-glucosyltransferase 2-like [Leptopilina boulardi]|uniref:UDP-glucosyltransferase 2-like n=1 Tax=Leptopilina boulardi TaxID=63433 RepID=UPI0021F5CB5C|nr:UDP-glucosyltransferase 2-like [Leptopilina boulardi]
MTFIQRYVIFVFFIFYLFIHLSEESRILAIFPNSKNEEIFNKALVKILLERGHHVDLITSFEMLILSENYKLLFNLEKIFNYSNFYLSNEFNYLTIPSNSIWHTSKNYANELCNIMGNKKIQKLLREIKKNSHYDVILMEIFGAKCFIGLGEFLKLPIITISNFFQLPLIDKSIGNSKSIFISNNFMDLSEIGNFVTRLKKNLLKYFQTYQLYYYTQRQTEIMRKYLDPNMPEIGEIEKNISLILLNSHFNLNSTKAVTNEIIQIGGLHINEDKIKLSLKLKSWMDKSTKGIVYFDLGSKILMENLPKKIIIAFLASFGKIKFYRILMKIKNIENFPLELPRNVKTFTNISRIQVLAHKNVKAFITLGENLAIQEALYFAIPIIGISISSDHSQNLRELVQKFVAFEINFENLNERHISEALTIVLKVKLFRIQTQRWSKIFKDRALSAKDTAIYWIEYIIKNGPNSLKSPTPSPLWYQTEFLDIYAFLLISLLSFTCLIVRLIKKLIKINEKFFIKIKRN